MGLSEIFIKYKPDKENLLGMLHEIQNDNPYNYLCEEDLKAVAGFLNTTYSDVYGVASYYSMYSLKPRGRNIIRVCNSPVCNMEGSKGIVVVIEEILGVKVGEVTPDGMFSLELTECLGRCSVAPGMMVGEDVYGELDNDKITEILKKYR